MSQHDAEGGGEKVRGGKLVLTPIGHIHILEAL
jgi:hypothetical protein